MDFEKLSVDKEDSRVRYNDELHKYWVKDTNQSCISVTTLIHQFTTFDEDFWSSYKALESLISEDKFKTIKSELTSSKIFKIEYLDLFGITFDIFKNKKIEILAEWTKKREESCVRGSNIHREQELQHLAGNTKELQHLGLGGKFTTNTTNNLIVGSKGVYPELLLSRISDDGNLRLAGQADLIIIDNNEVFILDYKTNKSIDKKSFFDRRTKKSTTMKYPLNNLQDTNF